MGQSNGNYKMDDNNNNDRDNNRPWDTNGEAEHERRRNSTDTLGKANKHRNGNGRGERREEGPRPSAPPAADSPIGGKEDEMEMSHIHHSQQQRDIAAKEDAANREELFRLKRPAETLKSLNATILAEEHLPRPGTSSNWAGTNEPPPPYSPQICSTVPTIVQNQPQQITERIVYKYIEYPRPRERERQCHHHHHYHRRRRNSDCEEDCACCLLGSLCYVFAECLGAAINNNN